MFTFQSPSVDANNPQQQEAATAIQTEYRRHSAKKEVDAMKEEAAATTIQAGVRGQQERAGYVQRRKLQPARLPACP